MIRKDIIIQDLIKAVAEKTGYPEDQINPSMSLESDLGVDSIGKVEILSSVSEQHGIDWDNLDDEMTEKLGNLQTLEEIVSFFEALPKPKQVNLG